MVLRVWIYENGIFHNWEGQSQPHGFYLTPHSMLTLWHTRANGLGTGTWRDGSPKTAILTTLPPHCLQLWTTWKL